MKNKKNITAVLVSKLVAFISSILIVKLMVGNFGLEAYGQYAMIGSILLLTGFIDFGLANNLVNELANYSKTEKANKFIQYTRGIDRFILPSIIAIAPIIFIAFFEFIFEKNKMGDYILTFLTLLILIYIKTRSNFYEKLNIANINSWKNEIIYIASSLTSVITIYWQTQVGHQYSAILTCYLIVQISWYLILIKIANPKINNNDTSLINLKISKGKNFLFLWLVNTLGTSLDNWIALVTVGSTGVATLEIYKKIFLVTTLVSSITMMYWPIYNELISKRPKEIVKIVNKMRIIILTIYIFAYASIYIFSEYIFHKWLGQAFSVDKELIGIMIMYYAIVVMGEIYMPLLHNTELIPLLMKINVAAAIASIVLKFIFAHHYGIIGIIMGGLLAYGFIWLIPSHILYKKITK